MSKIIIFGLGDIAQLANYYFTTDSKYEVAAFTVDNAYMHSTVFEGKPVVAFEEVEKKYPANEYSMFIAVSYANMNKVRQEKYNRAKEKGYKMATYISSRCTYLSQYACGDNCFILENNTIQPFVKIGNNVTLWSGNHIGHHSEIEDHNFISSHVVISGHCIVRPNCFIGVNATVGHKVTVAAETLLGGGVIQTKDTIERGVYVPAKSTLLEKKSNEIKL